MRTARPTRVQTAPPATPTPATAVLRHGFLTIKARPWSTVYVDGKKVASETPLRHYKLKAGRHKLTFTNPDFKFKKSVTVTIAANKELTLTVYVETGEIRRK